MSIRKILYLIFTAYLLSFYSCKEDAVSVNNSFTQAKGGIIILDTVGGFKIHIFGRNDTFEISKIGSKEKKIEYLVVGGGAGGSGGCNGYGAGGAGGLVISGFKSNLSIGAFPVVVGIGGKGTALNSDCEGLSRAGKSSSVFDIVATGGSAFVADKFANGGNNANYSGGTGCCDIGFGNSGGGGAGAGGKGNNAGDTSPGYGGDGGTGITSSITGISISYGGGGGGSGNTGICGKGGGNTGGKGGINSSNPATNGIWGGGGGGSANFDNGKNGGDGLVVIRYRYK